MNKETDTIPEKQLDAEGIETRKSENSKKATSRKSVYIYVSALFVVVLCFILLSYFVQQRNHSEITTLHEKNVSAQQKIENLQNSNLELTAENEAYNAQVAALEEQIADLEAQIREVRKKWLDDVQTVIDNDSAAYNELLNKYNELLEKYGIKVKNND